MDDIEFDLDTFVKTLKTSKTYDEFRMKCDLDNNECIITREEYDYIKGVYDDSNKMSSIFDSSIGLNANYPHVR